MDKDEEKGKHTHTAEYKKSVKERCTAHDVPIK